MPLREEKRKWGQKKVKSKGESITTGETLMGLISHTIQKLVLNELKT